jgi:hypothetical protein
MDFHFREKKIDVISAKINESQKNISKLINKKESTNNKYLSKINKQIKKYQEDILEEKLIQLNYIDILYEYLESNIDKKNNKKIYFQQKQLEKVRSKIRKEIKKYI